MSELPDFASNWSPGDVTTTVANKINQMLRVLSENRVDPPPVAIATAYINPGGFELLADELEKTPHVRLLLGAEPEQDAVRAMSSEDSDFDARVDSAMEQHAAWLKVERDTMGFSREPSKQAQRMVEWLRQIDPDGNARVEVRRYNGGFLHGKTYLVEDAATYTAIAGSSNMTYAGLSMNAELNLGTGGGTHAASKVKEWFEHFWELSDPYDLAELYGRLWDEHTPWAIYLRMLWELYGLHLEEEDPNARTNLGLTRFQLDGVVRMERLLDEHGGVLVADEVGLGKTYLAGEVIFKTANQNRQRVLVVAPAALKSAMWEPFLERKDFSRWVKVYSYEEIRNRLDPDRGDTSNFEAELADYSLVVVDEAHNLRNASAQRSGAVDRVITVGGRPKKVVLLTATPVNNSLSDLETLIRYFIRNDAQFASLGIPSIHEYIKRAQDMDPANLTPEHLFDLMDQVAVRRTRKFVKEHYVGDLITGPDGKQSPIKFPKPRVRRIDYQLSPEGIELIDAMVTALDDPTDPRAPRAWQERSRDPDVLMMARYLTSMYSIDNDLQNFQVSNTGLLRSGLLKRLESSPHALAASLERMIASHETFLEAMVEGWVLKGEALGEWISSDSDDLDEFVREFDNNEQIDSVERFHAAELEGDVKSDIELLRRLQSAAAKVVSASEPKVAELIEELTEIAEAARRVDARGLSRQDRRKVIIFSAYTDTIIPIHQAVIDAIAAAPSTSALSDYKDRVAHPIMGSYATTHARGESGGVDQGGRASTVAGFAPKTAGERKADGSPRSKDEFDILFTTDVLAEGVNLQQAGQMINYDLPWNPMRIVQRHGRVDRIGSEHDYVYLGLFFPAERLDELLALEERLEAKLQLADAAVGARDVLPGRGPGSEVNLTDENVEDEFEQLLDSGGSSASLSGEEYRRRLFSELGVQNTKDRVLELPFGSGSGFESAGVRGNGYVFCIKLGKTSTPWFRYVPVDEDWNVTFDDQLVPRISSDTLLALRIADPASEITPRWMTEDVYDHAFDAWQAAQSDVYNTWVGLTDPNAFEPDVPLSFRDAYELVIRSGNHLDRDERIDLSKRLQSVPTARVQRQVRAALSDGRTDEERIANVKVLLDDAGITAPPPREALEEIKQHEVRLVAWMAVRGTAD